MVSGRLAQLQQLGEHGELAKKRRSYPDGEAPLI